MDFAIRRRPGCCWPEGWQPFSGPEFQLLATVSVAALFVGGRTRVISLVNVVRVDIDGEQPENEVQKLTWIHFECKAADETQVKSKPGIVMRSA